MQSIFGTNDASIGHHRRYDRKSLQRLLERSGFIVEKIRYQNLPGIIPWWIVGKVLKRSLAASTGEGKTFDAFVPVIKFLENMVPPPVGLSLYSVCSVRRS